MSTPNLKFSSSSWGFTKAEVNFPGISVSFLPLSGKEELIAFRKSAISSFFEEMINSLDCSLLSTAGKLSCTFSFDDKERSWSFKTKAETKEFWPEELLL